jgi:hypothetical protein
MLSELRQSKLLNKGINSGVIYALVRGTAEASQ